MTTLLIQGGEIVTDTKRFRGDVLCKDDVISQIDEYIAAPVGATIVDAKGKFVFQDSSIPTCIFICRSWGRMRKTHTKVPVALRCLGGRPR